MIAEILLWVGYFTLFAFLIYKGRNHDVALSGNISFGVQAFAYVATYISAVALVGFGGLAHAYGLQMLLIAAGNAWLGTWVVYRYLSWPTKTWQVKLQARTPAQLLGLGHNSVMLTKVLALIFALFLSVYASAVIKGAALLLTEIIPVSVPILIWAIAIIVGFSVYIGGLRGVLYTEAMQGVVMFIGMVMLIGAVLYAVGGPLDGVQALAALAPTAKANNGFTALSSGEQGMFILSLVVVTSVAVWAQPQMMQRHFAVASPKQINKTSPLALFIVTVLVGGAYFAGSLSRLIIPEVQSPDAVMPTLVKLLLPEFALHLFVLAIVSASLSTATAIFHISVAALAEDLRGKKASKPAWLAGIILCIIISGGCAQIKGQLVALLCTTSWSIAGATALIPYLALVRFGKQNSKAALASALSGFGMCLGWYLLAYGSTALVNPIFGSIGAGIPPFFVGITASWIGWMLFATATNKDALDKDVSALQVDAA